MIEKFATYIADKSKEYIIFDIGSRDCEQSIEFYKTFPNSKIYAFECNPNTLDLCKRNIQGYSDRITLIEGAVCDYDGDITFYPINQKKTVTTWTDGNPGASSLFKSNGQYTVEKYVQDEIKVNAHRLDTIMQKYNIPRVDIIWMDLQGAELLAMKGLGQHLNTVSHIHTEVSHKEMYTGQVMFSELNTYMISKGFTVANNISMNGWQEDIIYSNHKLSCDKGLLQHEFKIYSQNKEDGITLEIINRILPGTNGYYVEFGTQNGDECNTRVLRGSWKGLLMDGSHENKSINLNKEFVTRENILDLFKKYDVPPSFNLLSIDVDFNDFYILHKIVEKYSIDMIILEYNASFLPNEDAVIKYEPNGGWDCSNYFGASLLAYQRLLNKYNYSLVYTESRGINAFFVNAKHASKFKNVDDIQALYNSPKYGSGPRGGHTQDAKGRAFVKSADIVNAFDIVIPVGPKDKDVITKQIEYTKKNIIGYRNIYLICYDPSISFEGCITINERIFPFNIDTIASIHGRLERNGWYLQQLLKLYSGIVIPDILHRYLVIDSDTFFLKPTIFIQDNKCLYNYGNENHGPYFEHMTRLNKDFKKIDPHKSGICHHMMFETKYLNELFSLVETEHKEPFYKVFLRLVTDVTHSGASEYEIYFNYMLNKHTHKIIVRSLDFSNSNTLDINSNKDYISYHWYMR